MALAPFNLTFADKTALMLSAVATPSAVTLRVTEPAGSRASAVSEPGRATLMPADLFSESVNRMNVASRKKMTSMRGMISMRAFFFPPLARELVPPAMVGEWEMGR